MYDMKKKSLNKTLKSREANSTVIKTNSLGLSNVDVISKISSPTNDDVGKVLTVSTFDTEFFFGYIPLWGKTEIISSYPYIGNIITGYTYIITNNYASSLHLGLINDSNYAGEELRILSYKNTNPLQITMSGSYQAYLKYIDSSGELFEVNLHNKKLIIKNTNDESSGISVTITYVGLQSNGDTTSDSYVMTQYSGLVTVEDR
jgi:hypothetical protein